MRGCIIFSENFRCHIYFFDQSGVYIHKVSRHCDFATKFCDEHSILSEEISSTIQLIYLWLKFKSFSKEVILFLKHSCQLVLWCLAYLKMKKTKFLKINLQMYQGLRSQLSPPLIFRHSALSGTRKGMTAGITKTLMGTSLSKTCSCPFVR